MAYRSTHLIANRIVVNGELPFDIGGGVTIRRPNKSELDKIREVLNISSDPNGYSCVHHESVIVDFNENKTSFYQSEHSSDWHYYVLSDDVGGSAVYDLAETLLLLEPSIELSVRLTFDIESGNENYGHAPPPAHIDGRYYKNLITPHRTVLSLHDFQRADEIRLKLKSLHDDYEFIGYALKTISDLRKVTQRSRLQVVGLFSVIENLVTHDPRLKESLDSISHQLSRKLKLLTNETKSHELLSSHFGKASEENVWKKLYEYRSLIAHGSKEDFNGRLKDLKSNDNVIDFLFRFTKVIWLYALENPIFIADLKEC